MFPLSSLLSAFVRVGTLTVIDPKGRAHVYAGEEGPEVTIRIKDPILPFKIFCNPSLYAGEAYMDGGLTIEEGELRDFLGLYAVNSLALENYPLQRVVRMASKLFRHVQQNNKIGRARRNVAHHYDLGNPFYKLFLDEDMQYSCAYFESPEDSLETAQRNKERLIAAKLNLQPGNRILDIGCGWGGMALYLASIADVEVLGVTLSQEQCELANERARQTGLADRVRFELRDYRSVGEQFDRIVSVGMFEHVGVRHYDEFFGKVSDLLKEDGVGLLHSIGRMGPPDITNAWIRKYIFPGGYMPSLSEVFGSVERKMLWINDVEILRLHYAETLREWDIRFQANRDKVAEMYDERFCRMWEFYLNASEMVFRDSEHLVFQMQFAHKRDAVPITRDYIAERQRQYRAWETERDSPARRMVSSGD